MHFLKQLDCKIHTYTTYRFPMWLYYIIYILHTLYYNSYYTIKLLLISSNYYKLIFQNMKYDSVSYLIKSNKTYFKKKIWLNGHMTTLL